MRQLAGEFNFFLKQGKAWYIATSKPSTLQADRGICCQLRQKTLEMNIHALYLETSPLTASGFPVPLA